MAYNKEAIVIVLDVGSSMNQAAPGEQTFLETSIAAIKMILQRKLFAESKDEVALILFGTDDTANELAVGDSYEHITMARALGMVDWELMQFLDNNVNPTDESADFLDAIVVSMDHLMKSLQGKRGFASKRMIFFSDVGGAFTDDQLDDIIGSCKEHEIELNVIGPDLDDDEEDDDGDGDAGPSNAANARQSRHQKIKTPQQMRGEELLKRIIKEVNGASYSFAEALPALSFFQTRQVRPTAWKCHLEIGPDLQIPLAGFIKIKEAKAKGFKNVYAKDPDATITRMPSFHLNDDEETEVDSSDTVEGHRYGSTLVPIGEEDKDAMRLPRGKCFKVLGFTDAENVKRQNFLGDSTMVVFGEKGDEAAGIALSALVQGLYLTNTVAIVRRCYSNASAPKIGVLVPHIKANYECLFYNELPFAEDVRLFTFGSLPLTDNAPPAMKKFQPTDAQLNAVDELIDTMDLTNVNREEDEDDKEEALKPKHTFNPHLQRLYQCLQHRVLHPDDPLPELSDIIANSLKPPQEITTCSEPVVEKLSKLFKLEEVAKKKDGENVFADVATDNGPAAKKAKTDDTMDGNLADLVKNKVTEVGTVTPVEDFKALVSMKTPNAFAEAVKMMVKRIQQIVMDSFGNQFYPKAMECLTALRAESIKSDSPHEFNDFLRSFKDLLHSKGRKDFWKQIVKEKVTLINKSESEKSRVTKSEADDFIAEKAVANDSKVAATADDDEEDLLDQLE